MLYRILYYEDDNVVMMPKGREQVLRSTWGVPDSQPYARALARKKKYVPTYHLSILNCLAVSLDIINKLRQKTLQPIMAISQIHY